MNVSKYEIEPKGFVNNYVFYWRWSEQEVHFINNGVEWNRLIRYLTDKLGLTRRSMKKLNNLGSFMYCDGYYTLVQYRERNTIITQSLRWVHEGKVYNAKIDKRYLTSDKSSILETIEAEEELRAAFNVGAGMFAYNELTRMFQEYYHLTATTIYDAYSGKRYEDRWRAIKNCVPKQIGYIDPFAIGKVQENCYKADKSSAFPAQTLGALPTLHYSKMYKGYVEPNEEYPFAFYIHSHHMAIYNELSTMEDSVNYFNCSQNKMYVDVPEEEEETILCKAMVKYPLAPLFEEVYSKRHTSTSQKEINAAKLTMNATIGYFQLNKSPKLSFISAVVIARSNHDMLVKSDKLQDKGARILYIATDSIVWQNVKANVATDKKYLGSFTYEMEKPGKFFGIQVGAYQIMFNDGRVETRCSYLQNGKQKDNMPFGELPYPKHNIGVAMQANGKIERI